MNRGTMETGEGGQTPDQAKLLQLVGALADDEGSGWGVLARALKDADTEIDCGNVGMQFTFFNDDNSVGEVIISADEVVVEMGASSHIFNRPEVESLIAQNTPPQASPTAQSA